MLKIITWNVNSIQARLERVSNFLREEDPDILCLQELKCTEEKFPFTEIEKLGYQAAVYGQKTYNGVAILAKEKITKVVRSFGDNTDDPAARFIGGTVAGIQVYSAYIPNGQEVGSEKYQYKLSWLKRLKTYFEKHHKPKDKIVLVGDFNVAPADIDVHDPEAWRGKILFSEPEKKGFEEVLNFGFKDSFRYLHKEGGLYSWWDYRQLSFPRNNGLRIDFVLVTAPLLETCKEASIYREERKGEKPSDHAPVGASFKL